MALQAFVSTRPVLAGSGAAIAALRTTSLHGDPSALYHKPPSSPWTVEVDKMPYHKPSCTSSYKNKIYYAIKKNMMNTVPYHKPLVTIMLVLIFTVIYEPNTNTDAKLNSEIDFIGNVNTDAKLDFEIYFTHVSRAPSPDVDRLIHEQTSSGRDALPNQHAVQSVESTMVRGSVDRPSYLISNFTYCSWAESAMVRGSADRPGTFQSHMSVTMTTAPWIGQPIQEGQRYSRLSPRRCVAPWVSN